MGVQSSGESVDAQDFLNQPNEIVRGASVTGLPVSEEAHFPVVDRFLERYTIFAVLHESHDRSLCGKVPSVIENTPKSW